MNLDALQKAAEATDYNLQINPEVILKLIEIARAASRCCWLNIIDEEHTATQNLFKALEGVE